MTGSAGKFSPQPGRPAVARAWPHLPARAGAALFTPATADWLLPLLRPHRRRLALLLLISFLAAGLGLLPPYISKLVIDRGLIAGDAAQLVTWSLALFAVGLLATGTGALSSILHMRASVRMLARLRRRLLSRLAAKPAGWFAAQRAGELLSRIDGDAAEVQKFAFNAVLGGSSALIRLIGGSAMLMVLDWRLGLLTALLAPAELAFLAWARPRTERHAAAVREMQGRYAAGLSETLFGLPALQAARGTLWAERRSLRDHDGLSRKLIAQNLWGEFTRAVPVLLSALTRSAIFLAGGLMVIRGEWPLGSLIAFIAYMGFMTGPMQSLLGLWHAQARVKVAAARLNAVMQADAPARTAAFSPSGYALRLDGVTVSRGAAPPLGPLSLTIPEGTRVALRGASGAGKTSLLAVLCGRAQPLAGRATLGGADLALLDGAALPPRVAFAGQRPFTLRASLRDNLFQSRAFWADPDNEAEVWALLELFGLADRFRSAGGLATLLGESGLTLSGGERQRLCLLRALLAPFDILILDEALSEVDPAAAARILAYIDARFPHATRILTAHGGAAAGEEFGMEINLTEAVA
ncbi:ABC transporter transmembrane domain-containing protein [Leisingera daeponensis]|uniref:ABC transporter transmembrane domain-containing protein n=1 Tax=Leisingera daeponensis TaxID=405746 RepID=UPI001C97F900|nr:ABC transporter ATP-binding protein [Leisingera daeponensis]MBY6057253.1 ABC transporter ATP-binding protein/permease [Leisingera daeponensis]